jgi:hypothetical protein
MVGGMRNDLSDTALPMEGLGAMREQEQDDDFKDSFYLRVIQRELGDRLRKLHNLTAPWPQRWNELLQQLDRAQTGKKLRVPRSSRDTEEQ